MLKYAITAKLQFSMKLIGLQLSSDYIYRLLEESFPEASLMALRSTRGIIIVVLMDPSLGRGRCVVAYWTVLWHIHPHILKMVSKEFSKHISSKTFQPFNTVEYKSNAQCVRLSKSIHE